MARDPPTWKAAAEVNSSPEVKPVKPVKLARCEGRPLVKHSWHLAGLSTARSYFTYPSIHAQPV